MTGNRANFSVLLIAHSWPPHEYSGTPITAHQYACKLTARGVRVGALYGTRASTQLQQLDKRTDEVHGFTRYEVPHTNRPGDLWCIYDALDANPERARMIQTVLDDFRPSLVHVIDLVNLPGEWPEIIKS